MTNEYDRLIDGLKQVFKNNCYRKGTKAARTCEYSFLQGAVVANPELIKKYPMIYISIVSGRSLLD
jgi:hypothetical protein